MWTFKRATAPRLMRAPAGGGRGQRRLFHTVPAKVFSEKDHTHVGLQADVAQLILRNCTRQYALKNVRVIPTSAAIGSISG